MTGSSERASPLVGVVDDDESVRESLPDLLRSFGFAVDAFASAEAFLSSESLPRTDCLILDIAMPGMSGPELQHELAASGHTIPIVFITAHGDEDARPQLIKAGAVDYLLKPFSEEALVHAVRRALSVP
jgi:FixJ family two-component response regulator